MQSSVFTLDFGCKIGKKQPERDGVEKGPSWRSRWISWNIFIKYRDFHPVLWKGVLACTVRLLNSQGTKKGSGPKAAVALGCTSEGDSVWGFGPVAPNVVKLLQTNRLAKGFLRCCLDSQSFRCSYGNSSPDGRKHLGFNH